MTVREEDCQRTSEGLANEGALSCGLEVFGELFAEFGVANRTDHPVAKEQSHDELKAPILGIRRVTGRCRRVQAAPACSRFPFQWISPDNVSRNRARTEDS